MTKQLSFFNLTKYFVCFLTCIFSFCFAEVSVKVSKNKASLQESISLIFNSSSAVQNSPDFSSLNQDFDILSTSQSQNITLINGSLHQELQWNLIIAAKKEGVLQIPPIQFGNSFSPPLEIEISGTQEIKNDDSLFIETEISPTNTAYDRSQILYTIRFYRSVNIGQATFSEPKLNDADAIIERWGKDSEYEYYHANGNRYVVFERKYAIFPQNVGELTFSPIIFSGQIVRGNSFFNMQTEHKRAVSNSQKIDIQPIPSPFNKKDWLAAYDVKLSEEWSSEPNKITIGEPITWTLKVTADGCLGNLIPDIELTFPDSLKQYRDKAEISNQPSQQGILGTKQLKVALIANQSGQLELPAIEIKWWNLKTNQVEIAQIPAKTIEIQNDPLSTTAMVDDAEVQINKNETNGNHEIIEVIPMWAKILVGMNIFWLALIGAILYTKRKPKIKMVKNPQVNTKNIQEHLKQACLNNEPKKAEAALIDWAAFQFPKQNLNNLSLIKINVEEPLKSHIDRLYHHLYGFEKNWNGKSLLEAFKTYKKTHTYAPQTSDHLEDLQQLYSK